MIELLLSYNVDTGEALLHAIDEEFVEGKCNQILEALLNAQLVFFFFFVFLAVELLLHHEDLKLQKTKINEINRKVSCSLFSHTCACDCVRACQSRLSIGLCHLFQADDA